MYLGEYEAVLAFYSETYMEVTDEKNRESKISCNCSFQLRMYRILYLLICYIFISPVALAYRKDPIISVDLLLGNC
jgi:hypothetical protein